VAVIGGGIVGAAAAAFLAEAGASVVLVEREAIAAAASGRNSGVVQAPLDPVLDDLYAETVAIYRSLEDGDFRLPATPSGLLYVSHSAEVAAGLAHDLAAARPELTPRFLEGPTLRALEPSLHPAVAACRLDIGFPVAPGAATRALAARAERAGARLRIGRPAGLVLDGDRVAGVTLGGEILPTRTVIVAAGPWTPEIVDPSGGWRPIRPLWGVVAAIGLADAPRHVLEEAAIDETIEPGGEAVHGLAFSLVTAGGVSVVGSTFLDDEPDDAALVPAIVERARGFVPAIGDAAVMGVRRCARPLSLDGRPLVGPVPWLRGLVVAAGHGPWGISTGPAAGRMAADLALGREPRVPAALDPARFGHR
jgi:glycine/D-amino acid oxidase-like deaminating enzyme